MWFYSLFSESRWMCLHQSWPSDKEGRGRHTRQDFHSRPATWNQTRPLLRHWSADCVHLSLLCANNSSFAIYTFCACTYPVYVGETDSLPFCLCCPTVPIAAWHPHLSDGLYYCVLRFAWAVNKLTVCVWLTNFRGCI